MNHPAKCCKCGKDFTCPGEGILRGKIVKCADAGPEAGPDKHICPPCGVPILLNFTLGRVLDQLLNPQPSYTDQKLPFEEMCKGCQRVVTDKMEGGREAYERNRLSAAN